MSAFADAMLAGARFARTRWGWRWKDRAALLAWQARQIDRFLRDRLRRAPFYTERTFTRLDDLPIVDKRTLVTHFDGLNTRGIKQAEALAIALAAERSRDFRPEMSDITVGLSSGTSGQRGLFLVSRRERLIWAGSILARLLDTASLRQLASPWRAPLAVAFFLRANSNLYATLRGHRLAFTFHDLLQPLDHQIALLKQRPPDVLVAPATVLRRIADSDCEIHPRQVISVAETLETDDADIIARAFGCRVQQIYQATEGFLGYSCEAGRVHLNEECMHIEPEWLDDAHTRFHPIVTDFTRETQVIARYRLDDVLRLADGPCPCGRVSIALAAIDGRRDAILQLPGRAIFPDIVRRAMMLAGDQIRDYRIISSDAGLTVRLATTTATTEERAVPAVRAELLAMFAQQGVEAPAITFLPWQDDPPGDKCCRIRQLA